MRLLVVLSRVPYPLEKGDKLRAYHLVRRLAARHEVYLFCVSDQHIAPEHLEHLRAFCAHIEVVHLPRWRILLRLLGATFSRLPFQVAYFHHGHAQRALDRVIQRFRPDHVFCQLIRTTEYLRHRFELPKTLDLMDALSKGMERRTRNAGFLMRPWFRAETRRLIRYENLMLDLFDRSTIISAQDRDLLYHPLRDRVLVLPNGVDPAFAPREAEKRYDLLFTGNMGYPPNIDSVRYLVHKVLPLVRKELPGATLLVSGVDPAPQVRELAANDPLVTVSGWVKDMRSSYASARVFAAPMQIGTGLQNKLLEAMAMGLPCVTSDLANNAVGATDGRSILIGHAPEHYARHIVDLLKDEALRQRISTEGAAFVRRTFDWDTSADRLERTMLSVPPPAEVMKPV
ncbi:MAG TPA: glycosyltransferase [Flavobacteriales bacterium]